MTSRKPWVLVTIAALSAGLLCAQVQNIPNTTFPAVRTLMNSNFSYLDLNKIRYAGTWSSSTTYRVQELVIYSGASYISLQSSNLNKQPDTETAYWVALPGSGGGGGGTWGSITGTLSDQTDLGTALGLKANTSSLASVATSGSASDLSTGTLPAARLPAHSGDATSSAGSAALTLATVNSGSGACGDATHVCQVTTNAKGLVTAQTAVSITGSGSPGGSSGQAQFNVAGSFGGQSTAFGTVALSGTKLQRAVETTYWTLTQGGNLTLPAQTTPYSVNLATGVACNNRWMQALISVTTTFSGGTGGLTAKLQFNGVDITSAFSLAQTGGDVNFYNLPISIACMGASTANLSAVFTGDASHNLDLYTAGAVTLEVAGYVAR